MKKQKVILSPYGHELKKPSMFFNRCEDCYEHFYSDCRLKTTCVSCGHWERDTEKCLIHGDIPDFLGCCLLFKKLKIYDCIHAVVIETTDRRVYCSLLDGGSWTCEKCYEMLMEKADREDY